MEISGWLLVFGVAFAGFWGGVLSGAVGAWLASHRIQQLEYKLEQLHLRTISGAGVASRQEKAERMSAAMAEAIAGMQKEGANATEVLKAIALKYPDVALDVAKKVMKGKVPGMQGII